MLGRAKTYEISFFETQFSVFLSWSFQRWRRFYSLKSCDSMHLRWTCVCQHGSRINHKRDLCHTVAAITVFNRCVDDYSPSYTDGYLCSYGDGSPLPILPGSDGLGRCELDVSRLRTVGDCSANYTEFHAWPDQRAYNGPLARSNDAGRNYLGTNRRVSRH
jgi:hypothetical protein